MAGILSPSMPVLVVVDGADRGGEGGEGGEGGGSAYCSLNEGLGKVLRFGAHSEEVLVRLRWMRDKLGPLLDAALTSAAPRGARGIALRPLLGAALAMGDDGHNRCKALTALLLQALAPPLAALDVRTLTTADSEHGFDAADAAKAISFLAENAHFGLNVAMGACKLALDRISGLPHCSYASAMCRNGVDFGVRVGGAGGAWHVAPSPAVSSAVWFKGYGPADACRDLGDSAITETLGLGAPAMACAPALMAFVGGTAAEALTYTAEARRAYACAGLWAELQMPALDFAGVPMLLDAALVVANSARPAINTGIAHKEPGVGQIGAGVSRAPLAPFEAAVMRLAAAL